MSKFHIDMYYPFLRAKRNELKALREFSSEGKEKFFVTPILEPVKQVEQEAKEKVPQNPLVVAIRELIANKMKFALVLNPMDGAYKHDTVSFDPFNGELGESLSDTDAWISAFDYKFGAHATISSCMTANDLKDVMIIFRNGISADDVYARELIHDDRVSYIVCSFTDNMSRGLRHDIMSSGKHIISLKDCFPKKANNGEYVGCVDESFSDEVFFYREDGLQGFSDYTTLPSEYIDGGITPKTLVIHFTYKKNDEEINVHHFVSDSNQFNTDIKGKFHEAAVKVAPFYRQNNYPITAPVQETIDRSSGMDGYPGLGYIKKLSIKNHLLLMQSIIKNL